MAGIFDKIGDALSGKPAVATGNATSGLDTAMAAHADKLHPVGAGGGVAQANGPAGKITRNKDGSLHFPLDGN